MAAEIDATSPPSDPAAAEGPDDLLTDFAAEAPGEAKYRTLEQMSKVRDCSVAMGLGPVSETCLPPRWRRY